MKIINSYDFTKKIRKIFLLFINTFILIIYLYYINKDINNHYKIYNVKIVNNSFKLFYFKYSGNLDYLYLKHKYYNTISSNNSRFLTDLEIFEKKLDFIYLKIEKTKIENIIIILFLYPFLEKNATIFYKIHNIYDYNLFKKFYKIKKKKFLYKINITSINFIIDNLTDYIYDDWEIILENELTNEIRYLFNNYYNETFQKIFDNSLNLNLKRYIKKNRSNITNSEIKKLMSKIYII